MQATASLQVQPWEHREVCAKCGQTYCYSPVSVGDRLHIALELLGKGEAIAVGNLAGLVNEVREAAALLRGECFVCCVARLRLEIEKAGP